MPRTAPVVVELKPETALVWDHNSLGQVMGPVGEYRFRVVGVMTTQGQVLGLDPDKVT